MRRVIKLVDSEIVKNKLTFKGGKNNKLRSILAKEQNTLCAYTETYLASSDDAHIEHFNPTLKDTPNDGYTNWFLVKSLWNTKKSKKWTNYQPVLHPTAEDLEQRILYIEGHYVADPNDIEAQNLIRLLDLDNARLADQRKRYVTSKKQQISNANQPAQQFIDQLITTYPEGIYFIRALEEELGIKVDFDLLNDK